MIIWCCVDRRPGGGSSGQRRPRCVAVEVRRADGVDRFPGLAGCSPGGGPACLIEVRLGDVSIVVPGREVGAHEVEPPECFDSVPRLVTQRPT